MRAPQNNLFVEVESRYNDEVEIAGGKKLFLTTQQFHRNEEVDAMTGNTKAIKPVMIRRHYGKVIGLPIRLTDAIKVRQVDPGLPAPGYLSGYKYKWITCADFKMEVEEGDKIYFHHNTVYDDNLVPDIGPNVYKLEYQNAICVVRNIPAGVEVTKKCLFKTEYSSGDSISGWEVTNVKPFEAKTEIKPVAGHVIVEPIWEEGVEDLGDGKRGKLSKSGLVTELHDKPEPLKGRVVASCSPMGDDIVGVEPGDKIIYLPHADYEVEIEGKSYYVMKYWEIIAKFE